MREDVRPEKKIPFDFVLDKLQRLDPFVRPMFGCFAVYIDVKIMLILRNRKDHPDDNGVWMATASEHHDGLRKLFPSMRNVELLGKVSKWQNLPLDSDDFEESVLNVCGLILKGDERIGAIPKSRASKKKTPKKTVRKKSSKKS